MFARFTIPKGAKCGLYRSNLKTIEKGRTIWVNILECGHIELNGRNLIFSNDYTTIIFASEEDARDAAQSIEEAWSCGKRLCFPNSNITAIIR